MSEVPAPRTRKSVVIRLVLGTAAVAGAWFVLRHWASVAHEVEWVCAMGECSTNDVRVLLVIAGIALGIAACALLAAVVRVLGAGIALVVAPMAAVTGWRAAVADGQVTADSVSGQVGFWRTVAVVGAVVVILGLVVEVRAPGPVWRLFGWEPVPAELGGEAGDLTAVTFIDRTGRQHVVRTRVAAALRSHPVRVYYLVDDPSRVRVVPGRKAAAVSTGTEEAPGPWTLLATELTRLSALHAEGHLTDAEFEQAKRRVLDL
jgi:hypothetical protein